MPRPVKALGAQESLPVDPTIAEPNCSTVCATMQKRLVSRDTSPIRFCREESVRINNRKIPVPSNSAGGGI